MEKHAELEATIQAMVQPGKGLLAADESHPTIAKRFAAVGVENTEENRRAYRSLLFHTPEAEESISGVILFEETMEQSDDQGTPLPRLLADRGIVPGIKVDKGKGPLPGAEGDMITYGLDGLKERLEGYKELGARFAKWREVYPITDRNPTQLGLTANAEMLARYAAVCQQVGIVPIVEPEVLIDGNHSLERAQAVNEQVLHAVFHALHQHGVLLEGMVLKPSMVTPGKESGKARPEVVAQATLMTLRRTVPAAVPSINFLSGGQTPEEATMNLQAINEMAGNAPWQLSFSYGRALQEPAMEAWKGQAERAKAGQQAFAKRARLNGAATRGDYKPDMESA